MNIALTYVITISIVLTEYTKLFVKSLGIIGSPNGKKVKLIYVYIVYYQTE